MDWAAALIDSSSLLIASPFNQATKQRDPKTGEVKTKKQKSSSRRQDKAQCIYPEIVILPIQAWGLFPIHMRRDI